MQIDNKLYGKHSIYEAGLWIEDDGFRPKQIEVTPRIGVSYAGKCASNPWRFILKDDL